MIFRVIVFIICLWTPFVCTWMVRNWRTHTDKWLEEKWRNWLQRPLPGVSRKDRERITDAFPSEEWSSYPYRLIDAIVKPNETAEDVTKWAIYYTVPDAAVNDEEYRKILNLSYVSSHV